MKLLITKTTQQEIDIEIPCFFSTDTDLLAVLDEKTLVTVFQMNDLTIIKNCNYSNADHHKAAIAEAQCWPRISEVQFFEAYDKALESISLQPKVIV